MNLHRPYFFVPIKISQVIKLFLAITYTLICAAIIIPRIDHEPWYPQTLRTYDLPSGIDFSSYKEVTSDLSSFKLKPSEINALLKILWKRIKASKIPDADIALDDNSLTLHLPPETDSEMIYHLLSGGDIKILKPNDPDSFSENPILAYDEVNYSDSGLAVSDVSRAEFKSQIEQYSYIILSINKDEQKKWNTFASEQSSSSIGLFIDGSPNIAWMFAGSGTKGPTLVVPTGEADARIIASLFVEDPLPFNIGVKKIENKTRNSSEMLLQLYILLASSIAVCLLLRILLLKEKPVSTIASALTILGIFAMLKTSSIPVTPEFFITLLILSSLFLCLPTYLHLPMFTLACILGLFLTVSLHPAIVNAGHLFIIAGIFGILSSFFYEFINIYEEK